MLQEKILDIADLDTPAGQEARSKVITKFNNEAYAFDPQDPKNTVLQNLQLMGKPSNAAVFEKLKKIAGIEA